MRGWVEIANVILWMPSGKLDRNIFEKKIQSVSPVGTKMGLRLLRGTGVYMRRDH